MTRLDTHTRGDGRGRKKYHAPMRRAGASVRAGRARARARVPVACARAREKRKTHMRHVIAHIGTRGHMAMENDGTYSACRPVAAVVGRKSRPRAVDRARTTRSPLSDARATGARSPLTTSPSPARDPCGSPVRGSSLGSLYNSLPHRQESNGSLERIYDVVNYVTRYGYDI